MNKKIKTWISKAEQIYNHFAQRKNPRIWQELLNEISPDSPLFFKWRNQFLLYLNNHPFLSFKVYQFINQTFHISEDYYALMSKENIKKQHIIRQVVMSILCYQKKTKKKKFGNMEARKRKRNLLTLFPLCRRKICMCPNLFCMIMCYLILTEWK